MIKSINNNWLYDAQYDEKYIYEIMTSGNRIQIPHTNVELPYNYVNEKDYQIKSSYQYVFDADTSFNHTFIEFEGVAHYTQVYLNGIYVGDHKGGYTQFTFEITQELKKKENLLTVFVDSSETLNIPPFGKVIDYLTYGGIYREVNLIQKNEYYIKDVYSYGLDLLSSPVIGLDLEVNKQLDGLLVDVEISHENIEFIALKDIELHDIKESFKFDAKSIELWSLENPTLYDVKVTLKTKDKIYDTYSFKTGYREAQFTDKGFYLNGNHLNIIGLNRHQSYPYVGYAMPKSAQAKDADILKYELGVNLARGSHYPQSKHFLNRCDEIGLLVFEEIPGWQNIGDQEWKEISIKNVSEMILAHRNHPSIINWGVRINESQDDKEFYTRTNDVARKLDPHRQTGGIRNIEMVKPDKDAWLEDVYTYNDFDYRDGHALTDTRKVFPVSNIPAIVTEHSGHTFPTKSFDNEARRQMHTLRHLNIINHMMGKKEISGSIGWCAFDYNTHIEFGSGDRICYHGVMDMFRNTKMASAAYASQGVTTPYLTVSSEMNIGEHDRAIISDAYVFTNCDYVEMYRNDELVSTMTPNIDLFANLPHAPMLIDWFGNTLVDEEGYTPQEANRIKEIHRAITRYSIQGLPETFRELAKNDEELDHIMNLHNKYIQNWSNKVVVYKFIGYQNDKPVITVRKGGEFESNVKVTADSSTLINEATYDVTRLTIERINENGNRQVYSNDVFELDCSDNIEIIGDDLVSLIGGVRSFWVKSIHGTTGNAWVKISNRSFSQTVELSIR